MAELFRRRPHDCVRSMMGFEPTHNELITCLKIALELKKIDREMIPDDGMRGDAASIRTISGKRHSRNKAAPLAVLLTRDRR